MWKDIRHLWSLLTTSQRRQVLTLQWLILLMAIIQVIGVASILPFMAVVSDASTISDNRWLSRLYQASGVNSIDAFLFLSGLSVLALLTLSSLTSMVATWHIIHTGQRLGADMSIRLYRHYLEQPWLFHTKHHSATLTNHLAGECHRVMSQIINPLLQLNARLVTSGLLLATVFLVNPAAASIGALIFLLVYVLMYLTVRKRLTRMGDITVAAGKRRYRLMTEGFGAIKELMLLGRQPHFIDDYQRSARRLAREQGNMNAFAQLPRYLVELTAFGTVIMLVLYLLKANNGDASQLMPLLSFYALAGFKLLPAFQQIYASLAQVRGNLPALHAIQDDLEQSQQTIETPQPTDLTLHPKKHIALDQVNFTYPGKSQPALSDVSLTIPVNQSVAFVGPSGAGKTTCVDMLLGLLQPDSGSQRVDQETINDHTRRAWQNSIGYVPQSIFLVDASIRDNIALGLPECDIDENRLKTAIKLAHIHEFVDHLPQGIHTVVGEQGVQLSGGQRQRIGIARALYHDPAVLVLDEATSALDSISERHIMAAIDEIGKQKTVIIIAHRLSTVRHCNTIFVMDKGRIIASGSYETLSQNNDLFRSLTSTSQAHAPPIL